MAATDPHAFTRLAEAVGRSERLRRDLTAAEARAAKGLPQYGLARARARRGQRRCA